MREASAKSVLLVDDDVSIRQFLSIQLEQEGFDIVQAGDGIDAIMKLRDRLPQVIISDLQMPRMPGIEFITVVRERFPSIPIIVLAGAIPKDLLAEIKPDRCFEKSARKIPELMRAVHELAGQMPNHAHVPQAADPVHARPAMGGYIAVRCPDCLRVFQVASPPARNTGVNTAVCTHCNYSVSFLVDGGVSR